MHTWIEEFHDEAHRILKAGHVRSIDFAGSTYQIEVYDPKTRKTFWPFFQFGPQTTLQDAFCSCPAGEAGCVHLAAGYFKIFNGYKEPLHIRYDRSFWNHLCRLLAEQCGYESRFLKKLSGRHYLFQNLIKFEIKSKENLESLIEKKVKETPENSLKFSNLSLAEIIHWREGRPSREVRYRLSFWSDLAKRMVEETDQAALEFQEDLEGLPTIILAKFPTFVCKSHLTKEDLASLIPFLGSVKSPLQLFVSHEREIRGMQYDPQLHTLFIRHEKIEFEPSAHRAKPIDKWFFVPEKGFYPAAQKDLLNQEKIEKAQLSSALTHYREEINRFIPVHGEKHTLSYSMHFDNEWSLHFAAYLFEKGDLQHPDSDFLGEWVYLGNRGFFRIENALFETSEATIPPHQVSQFVNHHRIWLNSQEGFQTHLASIESHLAYTVTKEGVLHFHVKYPESIGSKDFGEWIYYETLGFFSKSFARLGAIMPGVSVPPGEVSSFIKRHRDELEGIPHFFTTVQPIRERGLELGVKSDATLYVRPLDIVDREVSFRLFKDFVYVEREGFCELPASFHLPDEYQQERQFTQGSLGYFFREEFPLIERHLIKIDPRLRFPHQFELRLGYLVRLSAGGLKAQVSINTEYGSASLADLYLAIQQKKEFFFSEAGLIDLEREELQWIKRLQNPVQPESNTVELSTMEFLRLDSTFRFLAPTEEAGSAEITRTLLKELREFVVHEKPNLEGLKSQLRIYQLTGVHWLWFLYRNGLSGLLCDEMGLGKTHQAMALLAAIANLKEQTKIRALIVCPTSVIYHWEDKLSTFLPGLRFHIFHGLKRKFPKEGIVLTTYGVLRVEKEALKEIPFELSIFDEIQVAKNPNSLVHEALLQIKSRMRLGLTGTPIENNLKELKALFDVVLPGYMPPESRYRQLFVVPIERDHNDEKKALLSSLIRPFILRRRKREVLLELPDKSEDRSYCELSEEQRVLYAETILQEKEQLIAQLRDRETPVDYIHVFALLSRLKQICDHPALIKKDPENYKKYESGKWNLFVELLDEAHESEQKVVVFSQYLHMLDIIEAHLKEQNWGYAQIRGSTVNRKEELRRFQEDPQCFVFIGSLQAAGLGIDLTAASVVILYDRWWNAARENQAIDRVHRIGQKWGVQVYKLITKHTIEEKIDQMITIKGRLMEEIVMSDDQSVLKSFTRSELIELLSF